VPSLTDTPTIILEFLRWRVLEPTALRFVRWQQSLGQVRGRRPPVEVTPLLHVRPDDFVHVRGAPALLQAAADQAGESALTCLLFEHPGAGRLSSPKVIQRVARCVAWLSVRGIVYERFDASFVHARQFVSGFSAWRLSATDEGTLALYWGTLAQQIGGDFAEHVRRYYELYAKRAAPVPVQPEPEPAAAPVPDRMDIAPTLPIEGQWWRSLQMAEDLTRRTHFDEANGPFLIHLAARARLDDRDVYVEWVDAAIYERYYLPLIREGLVVVPQRDALLHIEQVPPEWSQPWLDALREDVKERVDEEALLAQYRAMRAGPPEQTAKQYRIRTIEPLGAASVPFASGRLRLLVYDALPAVPMVDLFTTEGMTALGNVMRPLIRGAHHHEVALDGACLDRLVALPGGGMGFCGVGRFVPWPVYCSYVKRVLHGFYTHVVDEEEDEEEEEDVPLEAPYHYVNQFGPTFAAAWARAAAEYNEGGRDAIVARLVVQTGLAPPPEEATDPGTLLVFMAAFADGHTATIVKEQLAAFHRPWRDNVSAHYADVVRRQLDALVAHFPYFQSSPVLKYYQLMKDDAHHVAQLVTDFVHGRHLGAPAHYTLPTREPLLPPAFLAQEHARRQGIPFVASYHQGTASALDTVITGINTNWPPSVVGMELKWKKGGEGAPSVIITGYNSPTSLTTSTPKTVPDGAYHMYYPNRMPAENQGTESTARIDHVIGSPFLRACTSISTLWMETGYDRAQTHLLDAARWLEMSYIAAALNAAAPAVSHLGWLSRIEGSITEQLADAPSTRSEWEAFARAFASPASLGFNMARGRLHSAALDVHAAARGRGGNILRRAVGLSDSRLYYGPEGTDKSVWVAFENHNKWALKMKELEGDAPAFFTLMGEAMLDDSLARPVQPVRFFTTLFTNLARPEVVLGPGQLDGWDLTYNPTLPATRVLAEPLETDIRRRGRLLGDLHWYTLALIHESGALVHGAVRDAAASLVASLVPGFLAGVQLGEERYHLSTNVAHEGWTHIFFDLLRGDFVTDWSEEEGGEVANRSDIEEDEEEAGDMELREITTYADVRLQLHKDLLATKAVKGVDADAEEGDVVEDEASDVNADVELDEDEEEGESGQSLLDESDIPERFIVVFPDMEKRSERYNPLNLPFADLPK
jgi:hypothetical protein